MICPVTKPGPAAKNKTRLRHIGCAAVPLHGCFSGKAGSLAVQASIQVDPSGSHAVHADKRRKGLGHGFGEHVQSRFRSAIVGVAGPGVQSSQRADVHDSALCGTKMRESLPDHEKWPADIGFEDRIPLLQADAIERLSFKDGGVVDQDIQTAMMGDGCSNRGPHRRLRAHVALDGKGTASQSLDVAGQSVRLLAARCGR